MPVDHEWRREGVGGSDAITIMRGDGKAWQRLRDNKVKGVPLVFDARSQFLMALGKAMEPVVLLEWQRLSKNQVLATQYQATHPDWPLVRCTLDAIVEQPGANPLPAEIKVHFMKSDLDQLQEFYWPQIQHNLYASSAPSLHFAVLFASFARLEWVSCEPDVPYLEQYIMRVAEFQEFLATDILPERLAGSVTHPEPEAAIVRGRVHVWETSNNLIAAAATDFLAFGEQAERFDDAVKVLKDETPEDAVRARWAHPEGKHGVEVSVDRAGRKKVRRWVP